MVSYTDIHLEQSRDVNQLLKSCEADAIDNIVKMSNDSNSDAPVRTATKGPPSHTRVIDRRYNHQLALRPSKLAPIIVSTQAAEFINGSTEAETHVRKLVEDLKSTSPGTARQATSEIRHLSREMGNRILIASCGAISPLIVLLYSSDLATQEYAVTALLNLSINDNNKIAISNAEVVESLIHVLQTGTPEAKENAAATLYSLSSYKENKIQIGNSGAITPLVELLGSGTPRGRKDAANALFNLSTCTENKAGIVKSGAVKHLVDLMDPATGMVDRAIVILANLATIQEGRIAIAEAGGIPLLVEAIELGSPRGKENAAAALWHLCLNSNRCSKMVLDQGAGPPLVALTKSGTTRAKEKANKLIDHLRRLQRNYARRG
uniref:RING-type E3 ubiquitin transferase n=1 Tax=Opuntia streptacantha TaxID=393608 RepID=A0A7C9AX20_OPUST